MNRTNFIFSILLSAFISIIFVSCNKSKNNSSDKTAVSPINNGISNGKIAYVEIDSIFKYYTMAKEYKASMETKQKQLDADLSAKSRTFQADVAEFKSKVQKGLMTQANAQEVQQQLGAREQELYQLQDKYRTEQGEDAQVNQRKLLQNIMDYLKVYNKDKGFQYILANTFPSTILFADGSLNITNEVIKGLNDSYKKDEVKK
jgi:outer membrane protein